MASSCVVFICSCSAFVLFLCPPIISSPLLMLYKFLRHDLLLPSLSLKCRQIYHRPRRTLYSLVIVRYVCYFNRFLSYLLGFCNSLGHVDSLHHSLTTVKYITSFVVSRLPFFFLSAFLLFIFSPVISSLLFPACHFLRYDNCLRHSPLPSLNTS